MKLEDLLMQQSFQEQPQNYRLQLQKEVVQLQTELDGQEKLNRLLQCALHGPLHYTHLSSLLPLHVKVLLAELAVVEEEIVLLERKVGKLKQNVHQEQRLGTKWEMKKQQMKKEKNVPGLKSLRCFSDLDNEKKLRRYKIIKDRKACQSSSDMSSESARFDETWTEDMVERSRILESQSLNQRQFRREMRSHRPNDLSEQLIKCLVDMFIKMNQPSLDCQGSDTIQKLTIPCVSTSFNCKSSALPSIDSTKTSFDPYGALSDLDVATRDIGPYNRFIPITRSSLDVSQFSHVSNGNLRVLLYKLSHVDLTHLGYKQKLAFWINIYNACIMHAFFQHGLPTPHDKSLSLMNKAALNVGGIVLNALAMEHFILRHPCEPTAHCNVDDEEEMLLRHAYGLGYPEPNITFALCRGSWSSPALRVYTAEDVVNELGRARVEYLEAAIRITSKKRIVVPKLLERHMKDFADDMESLVEWVYSHTPRNGQLKRLIMECLNGDTKSHTDKLVVIQQYESEFRYLICMACLDKTPQDSASTFPEDLKLEHNMKNGQDTTTKHKDLLNASSANRGAPTLEQNGQTS